MKNIAVYCGSRSGNHPAYSEEAIKLGNEMVSAGYGLVYGAGNIGLMGIIADTVLAAGGEVIGVIPQALYDREVAHLGLNQLFTVQTMHERKALMMKHSDAFIAMPGGIGTFEELFEVLTWFQLGFHHKPIGLLNVNGYYDQLIGFLKQTVEVGFVQENLDNLLIVSSDPAELVAKLTARMR